MFLSPQFATSIQPPKYIIALLDHFSGMRIMALVPLSEAPKK